MPEQSFPPFDPNEMFAERRARGSDGPNRQPRCAHGFVLDPSERLCRVKGCPGASADARPGVPRNAPVIDQAVLVTQEDREHEPPILQFMRIGEHIDGIERGRERGSRNAKRVRAVKRALSMFDETTLSPAERDVLKALRDRLEMLELDDVPRQEAK